MVKDIELRQEKDGNYFVFSLLAIVTIGILIGYLYEILAGKIYFVVSVGSVILLFLALFFASKNDKKLLFLIKRPFESDTRISYLAFVMGFLLIIVLNLLFSLTQSQFSLTQLYSPIFFSSSEGLSSGISQSFSASMIENSPFTTFFYTVIVASVQEEFSFGLVLIVVGYMIGRLINSFSGEKFGRNFSLFVAFIVAIVGFAIIHKLNASYIGIMFFYAGLFRAILNSLIYFANFGLAFTIGLHMSNNLWVYVLQFGIQWFVIVLYLLILLGFVLVLLPNKKSGNIDALIRKVSREVMSRN